MKTKYRVSSIEGTAMKYGPLLGAIVATLVYLGNKEDWAFFLIFAALFIYTFTVGPSKVILKLKEIYITDDKILINDLYPFIDNFEIDHSSAQRVEYFNLANRILLKFCFVNPKNNRSEFVYCWPKYSENKFDTSKLYMLCYSNSEK